MQGKIDGVDKCLLDACFWEKKKRKEQKLLFLLVTTMCLSLLLCLLVAYDSPPFVELFVS